MVLQIAFCLLDQVSDEGCVLDSLRKWVWVCSDWDAIEVNQHVSDCAWLGHQAIQGLGHFFLLCFSGLKCKYDKGLWGCNLPFLNNF
jgi:hypothetical protein